MRIHSDTLIRRSFTNALTRASLDDVWVEDYSEHRSTKRARGFEIRLGAEHKTGRRRRNSGKYGAGDRWPMAATYDEHGAWIAELYRIDPNAIIGPYTSREQFHEQTEYKYVNLEEALRA